MHPSVQIVALVCLAVVVQFAALPLLLALTAALMLVALSRHAAGLRRMLRRSRFLFLMLLLIYAFATPGEYVRGWPVEFAPTYEGLVQGAQQVLRLAAILVALAILLACNPRENLMGGIYWLIAPLRRLRVRPERFAARLWLTLHYVEEAPAEPRGSLWDALDQVGLDDTMTESGIRMDVPAMQGWDWVMLGGLCLLCLVVWWVG